MQSYFLYWRSLCCEVGKGVSFYDLFTKQFKKLRSVAARNFARTSMNLSDVSNSFDAYLSRNPHVIAGACERSVGGVEF